MNDDEVVRALAALAQHSRLQIFRLLVVAGPVGLTPGALVESLGTSPTALSFHLKELMHAGLVSQERAGRYLIYRASFDRMNRVLGFLAANCCEGAPCELAAPRGCATC